MSGNGDSTLRTAISLLLDEAAPALASARAELDPAGAARVPLHISVLYPFVPRSEVTPELIARLHEVFRPRRSLSFSLSRVAAFPGIAVYAAPTPDEQLVSLIHDVAAIFPETPPYGGAFAEPVPHATLCPLPVDGDEAAVLGFVRARIEPLLPIACRLDAISLLEEYEPDRWRELERLPFRSDGATSAPEHIPKLSRWP